MTKRLVIIVEGRTEEVFKQSLDNLLAARLAKVQKPRPRFVVKDGRIPKGDLLKRDVTRLLANHDEVIALTDVYTGNDPRDFETAEDAKAKMRHWVGDNPHFHPHAAQYEFEAWLLPYWFKVQQLSRTNRQSPSQSPETVNHNKPPSKHLEEAYQTGSKRAYRKTLDAIAILRGQDLAVSANACPELKAFLNTILTLSGAPPL